MTRSNPHRIIWLFGLGYFCFYAPYSALVKLLTSGEIRGLQLLPATIVGTALSMPLALAALGWWKYAGKVRLSAPLAASGVATAVIIATTTLAYTHVGVSILFALLLMRGGVLIMAPLIDAACRRRVRWFSWTALGISMAALALAMSRVDDYSISAAAGWTLALYLSGYIVRLSCMTSRAKVEDVEIARVYFVQEMVIVIASLVALPLLGAAFGPKSIASELRIGLTTFWSTPAVLPALLAGVLYTALYVFGTLIYLDRRENTFCIPLNRCASLLAGVVASYALTAGFGFAPPSETQLISAAMLGVALLMLSPLHHTLEYARNLRVLFRYRELLPVREASMHQVFLFVCSGNTCRSPMAEAIANAEIARRRFSTVRAASAGLSARNGAPMSESSVRALESMNVAPHLHAARQLTPTLVAEANVIYCMTRAHREEVIRSVPSAIAKTECLDPDGDIPDPVGDSAEVYVACARRIQSLIRQRFDQVPI